jgi:hypothetical protein
VGAVIVVGVISKLFALQSLPQFLSSAYLKSIGPPADGIPAFDGVGKIDIIELTR